jgi:hypothetical protein
MTIRSNDRGGRSELVCSSVDRAVASLANLAASMNLIVICADGTSEILRHEVHDKRSGLAMKCCGMKHLLSNSREH